jgi:hypothetical protein
MASASVEVLRGLAWMVYGIPSALGVSASRSKTSGWMAEPRESTGPLPSRWSPSSFFSTPGESVAKVRSTAIATAGSSRYAEVRAPPPW